MNLYFILAIIASLLGPLCYYVLSANKKISRFFDGLVITSLICLVSFHILPESLEHSRTITIVAVVAGLIGPLFLSKLLLRKQCEIQKPFLVVSVLGFISHNMLDGAALVVHPNSHSSTHLLALAVAGHRLIESIALWKALSKSFGNLKSALALLGLSLAMVLGFLFGETILARMEADILHILQSLACGMIFHILLHPHHIAEFLEDAKSSKFLLKMQSAGAFCGVVLAVLAYLFWPAHIHSNMHQHHESEVYEHHHSE